MEKTEEFMDSVLISSTLSEEKVKQNVAVEIYEDYFNTEDPATNAEEFNVKTIISYPDPSKKIENSTKCARQYGTLFLYMEIIIN